MSKYYLMGAALIATTIISCKSSDESSYKKAYEKARAQELYAQDDSDPVEVTNVAPAEETKSYTSIRQRRAASTTTTTTTKATNNNTNFRQERLTVVSGGTLKVYNVVAGSFKSQDNANKRCNELSAKGFSAKVAQNPDTGMYRVIASSHDTKEAAISSRDKLRSSYPDAWLLYKKD